MERTWVTESAHDDKPLDWLFDLRYEKDLAHITAALEAALDAAGVGECQTAMLAAECVAFLRGSPADLHEDAQSWLEDNAFDADDALVALTGRAIATVKAGSELELWWREFRGDRHADWLESIASLEARVRGDE